MGLLAEAKDGGADLSELPMVLSCAVGMMARRTRGF